MNEGGQSSTGQLIDFVMSTHPAYPKLLAEAEKTGSNPFTLLGERLDRMRKEKGLETASVSFTPLMRGEADDLAQLTKDLHFYPDLVSFAAVDVEHELII
jgi:hypothetical protein